MSDSTIKIVSSLVTVCTTLGFLIIIVLLTFMKASKDLKRCKIRYRLFFLSSVFWLLAACLEMVIDEKTYAISIACFFFTAIIYGSDKKDYLTLEEKKAEKDVEAGVEAGVEAEVETETETKAETEAEAEVETEAETGAEVEVETEAEAEAEVKNER